MVRSSRRFRPESAESRGDRPLSLIRGAESAGGFGRRSSDIDPSATHPAASTATLQSPSVASGASAYQPARRAATVVAPHLRQHLLMSDVGLLRTAPAHIPRPRRMYAAAWVFYTIVLVAVVGLVRPHPVRMSSGVTTQTGIAAFNPGPVGTSGTTQPRPKTPTPAVKKPARTEMTRATAVSRQEMSSADQGTGAAGAQNAGSGSAPVNLGTGAGLTLLRKVTPTYPRMMEQARLTGTVVLEAIIHRDGTIGEVTLKSSSNGAFAQAAIEAVKQWRYSPIPSEGIVTVTVNFNLPR